MKKAHAFLLVPALILSLVACEKKSIQPSFLEAEARINTFKGPEVRLGEGKARSYLVMDHSGIPKEIGIEIDSKALATLPDASHSEHSETILPIHQKVKDVTPFEHIILNWNPNGHPPANVFTVPHFDFHFYTLTESERLSIPAYSPSTASMFNHFPPPGFMPAGYIPFPGGEPAMGKHWGNPATIMPFTKTMIIGSWDGRVAFIEPMITLNYLNTTTEVSIPYPQPQLFEKTGKYYPSAYQISTDEKTGSKFVSLTQFIKR